MTETGTTTERYGKAPLDHANPVTDLDYFIEWGGSAWKRLFLAALRDLPGSDLTGWRVLDIGTRDGRMSCFFALLGADVTGIDIWDGFAERARAEAARWSVSHRCRFIHYGGDLSAFPDSSFDLIFTKSVLVVVRDLDTFLSAMNRILTPRGRFVFLENGRGGFLHYLRSIRPKAWDFNKAHYFSSAELDIVKSRLAVKLVRRTLLPPVYLITGQKEVLGTASPHRPT